MTKIIIDETSIRTVKFGSLTSKDAMYNSYGYDILGESTVALPYYDKAIRDLTPMDDVVIANYTIADEIPDANVDLHQYLSEYLHDESEFLVFVDLLQIIFNDIKSVLDNFTNLVSVDSVTDIFLPKLSYLLNYEYNYDLPTDVNRDIIKRLIRMYKHKGTDQDILNAAKYNENPKWLMDTLFLPDADLSIKNDVVLNYPINNLFTHDVSAHSRTDRFQDSTRFRDGVLIIQSYSVTDKLREAIKRVIPAGIKIYYDLTNDLIPNDHNASCVDFGEYYIKTDKFLDYLLRINNKIQSSTFDGTLNPYNHKLSGVRVMYKDQDMSFTKVASYLIDRNIIKPPVNIIKSIESLDLYKSYKGLPKLSNNAKLSRKYSLDGLSNQIWVESYESPILTTDLSYNVSTIENLLPNIFDYKTGLSPNKYMTPDTKSNTGDFILEQDPKLYYQDNENSGLSVVKSVKPLYNSLSGYKQTDSIYNGVELRTLSDTSLEDDYYTSTPELGFIPVSRLPTVEFIALKNSDDHVVTSTGTKLVKDLTPEDITYLATLVSPKYSSEKFLIDDFLRIDNYINDTDEKYYLYVYKSVVDITTPLIDYSPNDYIYSNGSIRKLGELSPNDIINKGYLFKFKELPLETVNHKVKTYTTKS